MVMATPITRRVALTALGALAAGSAVGIGCARRIVGGPGLDGIRLTQGPGGGMGVGPVDMRAYMDMFRRHTQINRSVDAIPGGVRTTTESDVPELAAQLQAHVSSMYSRLAEGREVSCLSSSLPTLFRHAADYQRTLTFTSTGVIVEETAGDPVLVQAIRDHAAEVSGFVRDGMPAMMQDLMGPGGMMPGPHHR
ncbi:uncharacterized protein PO1_contig-075-19 [Mycobacterium sp. PO1]|nr:uncharacterized protein PO1_contig-075-19 [Mycobacterium sp. PO1]GFM24538.1 uncharacterized protein PO2_contig-041-19 [Mycobacterium sp. PO2]